jgi:hypothetical protein
MAYNSNPCLINTQNSALEAGTMLVQVKGNQIVSCDHIKDGVDYEISGCHYPCYYPTEKQATRYSEDLCPPCQPCGDCGDCADCQ